MFTLTLLYLCIPEVREKQPTPLHNKIKVLIGGVIFTAILANNSTAKAFEATLPLNGYSPIGKIDNPSLLPAVPGRGAVSVGMETIVKRNIK